MAGLHLLLWEIYVSVGLLGLGAGALRAARVPVRSLAVSGSIGVACVIALGGWLNLAGLLYGAVFFAVLGAGVAWALVEALQWLGERQTRQPTKGQRLSSLGYLGWAAGLLVIAIFAAGYLRATVWNVDDLQAYVAYAVKGLQAHGLQSDPYSERRINTSVGGGTFLDVLMLAGGPLRAMPFIDSVFGFLLYVCALWELGRLWRVERGRLGLVFVLVPVMTLIKVNLTIVYLAAAGFLAIVLLLSRMPEEERWGSGRALPAGLIAGGLIATKSTYMVFVVPLIVLIAFFAEVMRKRQPVQWAAALLFMVQALGVVLLVLAPWSVAQHRAEGTYLFPLLGKGFHASAYGVLPAPGQAGSLVDALFVAAPTVIFIALAWLLMVPLTRVWQPAWRAALFGYMGACTLSVPVVAIGLGGESVDRFVAPFAMPALLLLLIVVLPPYAVNNGSTALRWRRSAAGLVAVCVLYVCVVLLWRAQWWREIDSVVAQAFGRQPSHIRPYELYFDDARLQAEQERGARMQAALPAGAVALESTSCAFPFDFERNRIYIADFPGMAGPAPGVPVYRTAKELGEYLRAQGIQYLIVDRSLQTVHFPWSAFLARPTYRLSAHELLHHPTDAHLLQPWGRMESHVSEHVRAMMLELGASHRVMYDDGQVVVIALD